MIDSEQSSSYLSNITAQDFSFTELNVFQERDELYNNSGSVSEFRNISFNDEIDIKEFILCCENIKFSKTSGKPVGYIEKFENNLVTKCTIDSIDAILGCTRIVESIDGDKVSLNIQPGTQHDLRLRIPERGTYEIDNPKRGDLLVKININTPQKIHTKDELIELIRKKTTK